MIFVYIFTACIVFSACRTTQPIREMYIESHEIDTITLHDSTHIFVRERWKGDTLMRESIVQVVKIIQHQRLRDSIKIDTIQYKQKQSEKNQPQHTTFESVCKWLAILITAISLCITAVWLLIKK